MDEKITDERVVCRICGNANNHTKYMVRDMKFVAGNFHPYFECSNCGTLQIQQVIGDMAEFYSGEHFFSDNPDKLGLSAIFKRLMDPFFIKGTPLISTFLAKYFRQYYYSNYKFLIDHPLEKEARILDVGCGTGNLLYHMRDAGYKNLLGIDPFLKGNVLYKNGLQLVSKTIFQIEGKFDVIMFNHSFEHLPNPEETLNATRRLLTKGGKCIIRIPVTSSHAWKFYKQNWVQIDSPRHFYIYSHKSIELIANRASLFLESFSCDSTILQFIGSEQYVRSIPFFDKSSFFINPKSSIFSKKQIADYWRQTISLNMSKQGDQACFIFAMK